MTGTLEPLIDGHGRAIGDVRISVTDRCNFRCQYCMPAEGLPWLERADRRGRHRPKQVGHGGALGEVQLEAVGPGAFAQAGEEADGQSHGFRRL